MGAEVCSRSAHVRNEVPIFQHIEDKTILFNVFLPQAIALRDDWKRNVPAGAGDAPLGMMLRVAQGKSYRCFFKRVEVPM